VELVVSGPGLVNIYQFTHQSFGTGPTVTLNSIAPAQLCAGVGMERNHAELPRRIYESARERRCPRCVEAVDMLISAYGSEAGNLALRALATAGVYIGGGIAPKILPALESGLFLEAFRAKEPMADLVARFPCRSSQSRLWPTGRGRAGDGAVDGAVGDKVQGFKFRGSKFKVRGSRVQRSRLNARPNSCALAKRSFGVGRSALRIAALADAGIDGCRVRGAAGSPRSMLPSSSHRSAVVWERGSRHFAGEDAHREHVGSHVGASPGHQLRRGVAEFGVGQGDSPQRVILQRGEQVLGLPHAGARAEQPLAFLVGRHAQDVGAHAAEEPLAPVQHPRGFDQL
jgi:hypothetical protein